MTTPLLYDRIIRMMKTSFCPEKRLELQKIGLDKAFKEFITNKQLTFDDIIQIQEMVEYNIKFLNDIVLTDYITYTNKRIIITVGSLIDSLFQKKPILTGFEGCHYSLHIYYEKSGSSNLPICRENKRFYNSGYIERSFNWNVMDCPPLISYRASRITFLLYLSSLDLPSVLIHKIMTLL